jgi:hypothetical protein
MGFLTLLLLLVASAHADYDGSDVSLSANAGPHDTYSWGARGHLRFDRGELHGGYDRQLSSAEPGDPATGDQRTKSWTGGFGEYLNDDLGIGLDYDRLEDAIQSLTTDGLKVSASYKIVDLAYRHARNKLEQDFIPAGASKPVHGAFTYQSTYSASVDFDLDKDNSLTPSFSYSTFDPDLEKFSSVLSRPKVQAQTGFSNTLQSYERYSIGLGYEHVFSPAWTASLDATFAKLIIGRNPLVTALPSLSRKWSPLFSTRLNFNYTYQPAAPSWTAGLEAVFHFDRAPKPAAASTAEKADSE